MGDECDLQTLLLCKGNAKLSLTTEKKTKLPDAALRGFHMALASKGRGRDEDSGVLRGNRSVDVGQRPATGTRLFLRRNFIHIAASCES